MVSKAAPIVIKPRTIKQKVGRGFSLGELRSAGLTPRQAQNLGVYVDKRRKTVHSWNVELLRDMARESAGLKAEEAKVTEVVEVKVEERPKTRRGRTRKGKGEAGEGVAKQKPRRRTRKKENVAEA